MSRIKLEWRQFRRLVRSSSGQLLDNGMLAQDGDMMAAAANVLALLVSFGMALALLLLYKYVFGKWTGRGLPIEAVTWPDKQYLIAASMLAAGFLLVMTWDGLFPDRRDAMVVCPLPVRMRTLFAARLASTAWMLAAVVVAANVVTAIAFPTYMMAAEKPALGWIPYAGIHITAIAAGAAFAFTALLGLEGALILALPYAVFRRVSAWVQMAILFAVLFVFVLEPNATPQLMTEPVARLLPPVWFTALYQEMLGSRHAGVKELAEMARMAMAVSALFALLMYTLGYRKAVRKAVEEADAVPAARSERPARATEAVLVRLGGAGVRGAVFRFVARTLVRHRRNRLILAVYLSLALGYTLGDVAALVRHGGRLLYSPTPAIIAVSLVLLFFALLGIRVLFTIPVELKANWIFQTTEEDGVAAYRSATRRVMLWLGAAPICGCALPAYALLWGWRYALLHVAVLVLVGLILIEVLLRGFMKIPFTCSYRPGAADLKTKLGVWAILFSATTAFVSVMEWASLSRPGWYGFLYGLGLIALALLTLERRNFDRGEYRITFEERGEAVLRLEITGQ